MITIEFATSTDLCEDAAQNERNSNKFYQSQNDGAAFDVPTVAACPNFFCLAFFCSCKCSTLRSSHFSRHAYNYSNCTESVDYIGLKRSMKQQCTALMIARIKYRSLNIEMFN